MASWKSFGVISCCEVCIRSEPFVTTFLDKEINSHVLFLVFEFILLRFKSLGIPSSQESQAQSIMFTEYLLVSKEGARSSDPHNVDRQD